jgi:hypothetical protein
MFMEKLTNAGVAFALLGLGMLVGCSDDSSSIASTLSETNTGKPIAQLDTADFEKQFSDGKNSCAEDLLAKKASEDISFDEEDVEYEYDTLTTLEGSKIIGWGRAMCGSFDDIYLYADVKGRIVDPNGKPLANAKVYSETSCKFYSEDCQWVTTDGDGYFQMQRVNFLTYEEGVPRYADDSKMERMREEGSKMEHIPVFNDLSTRVVSEDKKFGTNISLRFAEASFVKEDGRVILDMGDVSLEPTYSVDVPLDSLYFEFSFKNGDEWDFVETPVEKALETNVYLLIEDLDCYEKNRCYNWAFNTKITLEDAERGYVTIDGLTENTYELSLYCDGDCIGDIYPDTLIVDR